MAFRHYIQTEGKLLRCGYTTGTCAALAAAGAAELLLTGKRPESLCIMTPKGIEVTVEPQNLRLYSDTAECGVYKDGGDDTDVTNGALIMAAVRRIDGDEILILGGEGVGTVTKPGLDQSVGASAITRVPREMIGASVQQVCKQVGYTGGMEVTISVPNGAQLAEKTFNPRLGIVGGISILGTTGIVEPMSEAALVETIRVELRQRRAMGKEYALLTPGNYGSDFIRQNLDVDLNTAVQVSNFLGDALDICRALGFRGALLVGHVGKLVKTAGGMMNTHSKYGDCRMEILAAHAAAAGVDAEHIREILDCAACDDAVRILRECGRDAPALARVTERALFHLSHRADGMEIGLLMFSKEYGVLGQSENAPALLKKIMEE